MSVDQAHPSSRIVVGVDGSESSEQALRWAAFLATTTSSSLEVVGVWQIASAYSWGSMGWAAFPAEWDPAEDARKTLEAAIATVFGENNPVPMTVTVTEGGPAPVLLKASRDARMLVLGSRGHGGFAGLLLGSVSTACAEHATCPVLVVHGNTGPPPS